MLYSVSKDQHQIRDHSWRCQWATIFWQWCRRAGNYHMCFAGFCFRRSLCQGSAGSRHGWCTKTIFGCNSPSPSLPAYGGMVQTKWTWYSIFHYLLQGSSWEQRLFTIQENEGRTPCMRRVLVSCPGTDLLYARLFMQQLAFLISYFPSCSWLYKPLYSLFALSVFAPRSYEIKLRGKMSPQQRSDLLTGYLKHLSLMWQDRECDFRWASLSLQLTSPWAIFHQFIL